MDQVLINLVEVAHSLWNLLLAILTVTVPWLPLIAWLAFNLFAIDWSRTWPILARGGWIGVVLLGVMAAVIWGTVAPPLDGSHYLLGLTLSNFVGKFVYGTAILVMMLLCGSVQLSGACGQLACFSAPSDPSIHLAQDSHTMDSHAASEH